MKKIIFVILIAFAFTNVYSQTVKKLSSFDDLIKIQDDTKGKVVLYNFWATWCKPCVEEFPEIIKLYNDYKDKGFAVVFISLDETDDLDSKVIPFLKKNNVDFTAYINDFRPQPAIIDFYDKQWEGAIPSTYIYDREGNLSTKFIGSRDYTFFEKEIKKVL